MLDLSQRLIHPMESTSVRTEDLGPRLMIDTSQMSRPTRVVCHCTTVALLLVAMGLSLLVLLTPTYGQELSMFTLKPIGLDRAPIAKSPTNSPGITDEPLAPPWRRESVAITTTRSGDTATANTAGGNEVPGAGQPGDGPMESTMYAWLGMHGPSVHVGVMRGLAQACIVNASCG